MKYRSMQISDYDPVIGLWRNCEGLSLRDADSRAGIEKYLLRNPGLSFVAEDETGISGSINPATVYIAFSHRVSVHSKTSERSCSYSTASSDNAVCGQTRDGLSYLISNS